MWLIVVTLLCLTQTHPVWGEDESLCKDDETEILSPWISRDDQCTTVLANNTDFYNPVYRGACQRWLGLGTTPEHIEKYHVEQCFPFGNGTIKYRTKVCCKGVADFRCFTCNNVSIAFDRYTRKWDTYACNHLEGSVETCSEGEVCASKFEYHLKPTSGAAGYVTKGCMAADTCEARAANNPAKCRHHVVSPECVYCCDETFCNWHHYTGVYYPFRCDRTRCSNQGNCTLDEASPLGYTCTCNPGRYGDTCQYSQCHPENPCENGGFCYPRADAPYYYWCDCRVGFGGQNCSNAYSVCGDNVGFCQNGGTCYDHEEHGLRCNCTAGFSGTQCELQRPLVCTNGAQLYSRDYYSHYNATPALPNCTVWDAYIAQYWTHQTFISRCISASTAENRFVQGTNGYIERVQAVATRTCVQGDNRMWYGVDVCCPACLARNPCLNGGWCIDSNNARGYTCKCRFGFEGENCQHNVALCFTAGDPHYFTFDEALYHFQGECKYDMASFVPTDTDSLPGFRVYTKNEHRHGQTHVSYPKYMEIEVFGHVIRLGKMGVVTVDGVQVYPPYPASGMGSLGFTIEQSGTFLRLLTNFSLAVEFDGDSFAMIKVPPTFAGLTQGLCANYDGNPDNDLTTRGGIDVSADPSGHSKMGISWAVSDLEDLQCVDEEELNAPECEEAVRSELMQSDYCGLIPDPNGVFSRCAADQLSLVMLANCLFDTCAVWGDDEAVQEAKCGSLKAFATTCIEKGFIIGDWREEADCPLECPEGMEYSARGPACQDSCVDPMASQTCPRQDREGCFCPEGELLKEGRCVDPEDCGCLMDDNSFVEVGDPCDEQSVCVLGENGEAFCDERHPCDLEPCKNGASCIIRGNGYYCLCTDDYTGAHCDEEIETTTMEFTTTEQYDPCDSDPCDNNGRCIADGQQFRCQCREGYTGTLCETIIDPCDSSPCKGNSRCVSNGRQYRCVCLDGYTGANCDTRLPIDGGWSDWGAYGPCGGPCYNPTQTRTRTCTNPVPQFGGQPCPGSPTQSTPCSDCVQTFDTQRDCPLCDMVEANVAGYFPHPCDCSLYYQCRYDPDAQQWLSWERTCPPCQVWNRNFWTCVPDGDATCDPIPITDPSEVYHSGDKCIKGGQEKKRHPTDDMKYIWIVHGQDLEYACSTGTSFNFNHCECLHVEVVEPEEPVDPVELPPAKCMHFDRPMSEWGHTTQDGFWVGYVPSRRPPIITNVDCVMNSCALFDGTHGIIIPIFTNAFSSKSEFAMSLWVKRKSGDAATNSAEQGLINNGDCNGDGTVRLWSTDAETVTGSVLTDALTHTSVYTDEAVAGVWQHIVWSYDGTKLKLYLDGRLEKQEDVHGTILNKYCPMAVAFQGFSESTYQFFHGRMDEVCFYDSALNADHVRNIYLTQGAGLVEIA